MVNNYTIVTVRNSSSRLPNKAIAFITEKMRSLDIVIHRAKRIGLPVIVATSTDNSDNIIAEIARENDVSVFRGALLNKIKRWKDCFDKYQIDNAVIVDGDDILFDFDIGVRSLDQLINSDCDMIICPENIVCSLFTLAFRKSAIDKVYKYALYDHINTDVITEFVERAGVKTQEVKLCNWEQDRPYRLTLDYKEDLDMFRVLIPHVGIESTAKDIISYLDEHKDITKINIKRHQDYVDNQKRFNKNVREYLSKEEGK